MKHSRSATVLKKAITDAVRAMGSGKTDIFIRYFQKDHDLVRVRHLYHANNYHEALQQLLSYIRSREKILHLTCCMLGGGFVNTYINDYKGFKNPCAIRSELQLFSLFQSIRTKRSDIRKTLIRLMQRAKKSKCPLLLMDKDEDSRVLFRELIHELNAWLYSGCAEGRQNLICMIKDWRMNLLKGNGYRNLDAYFFKNRNNTGTRRTKQKLKAKIIEVIHVLSKPGLLQTFVPLRKKKAFKHAYLYVSAAKRSRGERGRPILSYGVSFDSQELAMTKCLSELLERISFQWNNGVELRTVSGFTLENEGYFTDYVRGKDVENHDFGCVDGIDMLSTKKVLIPAQFIYAGYLNSYTEDVISPFTGMGSGVAAGEDHFAVLLNALYELIERDALMTGYLNNTPPAVVHQETLTDRRIGQVARFFKAQGLKHQIFEITNDLEVPTYLSLIIKNKNTPFVAGGVKSHHNPSAALYGAVEESYLEWILKQEKIDRFDFKGGFNPKTSAVPILTYDRYLALHRETLPVTKTSFATVPTRTDKEEFGKITRALQKKGHRILFKDITPWWLTDKYKVYRVFVPSLQPLFFTGREQWIHKKRIHDAGAYFRRRKTD